MFIFAWKILLIVSKIQNFYCTLLIRKIEFFDVSKARNNDTRHLILKISLLIHHTQNLVYFMIFVDLRWRQNVTDHSSQWRRWRRERHEFALQGQTNGTGRSILQLHWCSTQSWVIMFFRTFTFILCHKHPGVSFISRRKNEI